MPDPPPTHRTQYTIHVGGTPITITWAHQDGKQTIKGKYHDLVITHVAGCTLQRGSDLWVATEHCSVKDIYDAYRAKWGLLKKCVEQTTWDRDQRKAFWGELLRAYPKARRRRRPQKKTFNVLDRKLTLQALLNEVDALVSHIHKELETHGKEQRPQYVPTHPRSALRQRHDAAEVRRLQVG